MIQLNPNYDQIFVTFNFPQIIQWPEYDENDEEGTSLSEELNRYLQSNHSRIKQEEIDSFKKQLLTLIDYNEEYATGIDKTHYNDFLNSSLDDLAFLKNICQYFTNYLLQDESESNPYQSIYFDIVKADELYRGEYRKIESSSPPLKWIGLKSQNKNLLRLIKEKIHFKLGLDEVNMDSTFFSHQPSLDKQKIQRS
ncbi:hypothetical protein [Ekhidna sp.]|uniref:hypothetical protein n=1 Tax=Ekhidna sp. TaxID=2608089 RepID=UPI00329885BA